MKFLFKHGILCMVFFLGCSYGFSIRSNVARVSDEVYEPHTGPIEVFLKTPNLKKNISKLP